MPFHLWVMPVNIDHQNPRWAQHIPYVSNRVTCPVTESLSSPGGTSSGPWQQNRLVGFLFWQHYDLKHGCFLPSDKGKTTEPILLCNSRTACQQTWPHMQVFVFVVDSVFLCIDWLTLLLPGVGNVSSIKLWWHDQSLCATTLYCSSSSMTLIHFSTIKLDRTFADPIWSNSSYCVHVCVCWLGQPRCVVIINGSHVQEAEGSVQQSRNVLIQ